MKQITKMVLLLLSTSLLMGCQSGQSARNRHIDSVPVVSSPTGTFGGASGGAAGVETPVLHPMPVVHESRSADVSSLTMIPEPLPTKTGSLEETLPMQTEEMIELRPVNDTGQLEVVSRSQAQIYELEPLTMETLAVEQPIKHAQPPQKTMSVLPQSPPLPFITPAPGSTPESISENTPKNDLGLTTAIATANLPVPDTQAAAPVATSIPKPQIKNDHSLAQVPTPQPASPAGPKVNTQPLAPSRPQFHILQHGETLWALAKRYYSNPRRWIDIAKLNHIRRPDRIPVGQKLILP